MMSCRYPKLRQYGDVSRQRRNHHSNGGQSSMEFMIIFSFLLVILALGATVGWVRIYGISQANKDLEVTKVLDEASAKINLAFLEGDGFSINMKIPDNIFNQNYSISIYNNNVVIYFSNSTYSKSLLTENITGMLKKGNNTLMNRNGEILIT